MPKFDKSLDEELFSECTEVERGRITVAVFSYNGGIPKLQITRENKNAANEYTFTKLGRMTKEEVKAVMSFMEKAKQFL